MTHVTFVLFLVALVILPSLSLNQSHDQREQKQPSGVICTICIVSIDAIEYWLDQNATRWQIVGYMDKLCNAFPGSWKNDCSLFIQKYVPIAIDWITRNEPADAFCAHVGLCSLEERGRASRSRCKKQV